MSRNWLLYLDDVLESPEKSGRLVARAHLQFAYVNVIIERASHQS